MWEGRRSGKAEVKFSTEEFKVNSIYNEEPLKVVIVRK